MYVKSGFVILLILEIILKFLKGIGYSFVVKFVKKWYIYFNIIVYDFIIEIFDDFLLNNLILRFKICLKLSKIFI